MSVHRMKSKPSEELSNSVRGLEEHVGKDSPEEGTHWGSLRIKKRHSLKEGRRETQKRSGGGAEGKKPSRSERFKGTLQKTESVNTGNKFRVGNCSETWLGAHQSLGGQGLCFGISRF